jgi:carboxypeptidase Q
MSLARRQALVGLGALAGGLVLGRPALAREGPDLELYQAIREEGLKRSQAMVYAAGLADGVGARLMGSPNMRRAYDWSLARLRELGLSDPRLEPIGPFGLSWRQVRAWARMSAPDSAQFVAQASPWSVATDGPIEAEIVAVRLDSDEDLKKAKGRLGGKIVLLGSPSPPSGPGPANVRYSDEEVVRGDAAEAVRAYYRTVAERRARQGREGLFKARRNAFLAAEGVRAVVINGGGGEPGGLAVDGSELGGRPWRVAERPAFPAIYVAGEAFGRCWRLAQAGVSARLELEIATEEGDANEPGYNVLAEIPGRDLALKSLVVLAGAHLDSWATGTGAADNGAGVAATLEAVRILRALGLKPRRTIRVVLYGGEEQGLFGSEAYAKQRLGHIPRSTAPEQMALTVEGRRAKVGPLRKGPRVRRLLDRLQSGRRIGAHPRRVHGRKPSLGRAISRLDRAAERTWASWPSTTAPIGRPTSRPLPRSACRGCRSCRTRSITTAGRTTRTWTLWSGCRQTIWPRRPRCWRSS